MPGDTENMIIVSLLFDNLRWYCENVQLQKLCQIKKRAILTKTEEKRSDDLETSQNHGF